MPRITYGPQRRDDTSSLGQAYDQVAVEYDRLVEEDLWMRRVLWDRYADLFKRGCRVLEVGCGTGFDTLFVAGRGVHVTGIDASPNMIRLLRRKLTGRGLGQFVDARMEEADALSTWDTARFDGVFSAFSSLNSVDLGPFAAATARLLQPQGQVVLHMLATSGIPKRLQLLSDPSGPGWKAGQAPFQFDKTHRRRSASHVADEVEWILDRYSPEMLWMADDVFTIHRGWIFEYAAELKRRGLRVPFECITRADRLDAGIVDALAEMGCFRVWIGSKSGSQRILDAMERGVRVEQVQDAVSLCRKHNIETGMFLIWGYEGEQLEDIKATVTHVKSCDPDVFLTTVAYPIKGTSYHDEVAERVVQTGDWEHASDRESKIAGRHSRRYYDFADQLLKSEVDLQRLSRSNGTPADQAEHSKQRIQIAEAKQGLSDAAHEVEA